MNKPILIAVVAFLLAAVNAPWWLFVVMMCYLVLF